MAFIPISVFQWPHTHIHTHTHTDTHGAETCLHLLPLTWMCVAASWRLWWQGDIQHLVTWLHWGSEWGRGPVPLKAELFCLGSPTATAAGGRWELNLCLPITPAHSDVGVSASMEGGRKGGRDSLTQEAQSSFGLRGAGPDGRPVVRLPCERGMLGSHVSDRGRARWSWRRIGGWEAEGATPSEHWPVILIQLWCVPYHPSLIYLSRHPAPWLHSSFVSTEKTPGLTVVI